MKKYLLSIAALAALSSASLAQLNGDGYYRVQNAVTERYAYIMDNKGDINMSSTSIDALAIQLWKRFEKASSNPATVLYFKHISSVDYDVTAQGTGIYQMIDHYMSVRDNKDGTYFAYGRSGGGAKYLGDGNPTNDEEGIMSSEVAGDRRKWYIKPITSSGDNYFGVLPTVTAAGKNYAPFYTSFPYSAASSGVRFYAVTDYGYGMAVIEEIKGTVPANTPVYVECPSTTPSGNRLNIGGTGTAVKNNKLGGVYFENYMPLHLNLTPYNKSTMRLLGKLSDGSLGFVTGNIEYLRANESYLNVPAGSPAEIRIVTRAEYDAIVSKLPVSVSLDASAATLYVGGSRKLNATVAPADASDKSLTWTSSNNAVATVNSNGVVTAVAKGTATVTVSTINGKTATCTVTVSPRYPDAISMIPSLKLYEGDSQRLEVTYTPKDVEVKTLNWTSSNTAVATVASDGTVKALKAGTATITATTPNGKTAACALTVQPEYPEKISISSYSQVVPMGKTVTLTATVVPSDVKNKTVNWSSSDNGIATVDASGNVKAINQGNAVITAASPGGASATCNIAVVLPEPDAVELNLTKLILEVGDVRYLRASVTPENAHSTYTWTSSDAAVATVSQSGELKAAGVGNAVITVETSNGKTATCTVQVLERGIQATKITITPSSMTLIQGRKQAFQATVEPENVSNKFITWTSNNMKVATVDSDGNVIARSPGTSVIYAQCGSAQATAIVTVEKYVAVTEITLDKTDVTVMEGESFAITPSYAPSNASYKRVNWESDNNAVATVDAKGNVKAVSAGTATIIAVAYDGSGAKAECKVTVKGIVPVSSILLNHYDYSVVYGTSFTLVATVLPDDATDKSVSWTSSDTRVADVDNAGTVTVKTVGSATITVQALDGSGIKASCNISGTAALDDVLAPGQTVDVYSIDGILVRRNAGPEELKSLAHGVYIIGGRKVLVK